MKVIQRGENESPTFGQPRLWSAAVSNMQSSVRDAVADPTMLPTMLDASSFTSLCNEGLDLVNAYPSVIDAQGGNPPVYPQGALLFNPTASIAREKWVLVKFEELVEGPLPVQVFSKEESKKEFRRSPAKVFLKSKPNKGHDVYFHSRFVWGMSEAMLDRNKSRIKKIYNSSRRKAPNDVSTYYQCVDAFNEVQFPFLDYRAYELKVQRFDHQNYSQGRKLVITLITENKVPGYQIFDANEVEEEEENLDQNQNLVEEKSKNSHPGMGDGWGNELPQDVRPPDLSNQGAGARQNTGGQGQQPPQGGAGGSGAGGSGGGGGSDGGGGTPSGGSGSGTGGGAAGGSGGGQPPRRGGQGSLLASPEPDWKKEQRARRAAALARSKGGTPAEIAQQQQQQQDQQQNPDFVANLTPEQQQAFDDRIRSLREAEKQKQDLNLQLQQLRQQQELLLQQQERASQAALHYEELIKMAHTAPNPGIRPGLIGKKKKTSATPAVETPPTTVPSPPPPPSVTSSVTAAGTLQSTSAVPISIPTTVQVTSSSLPPPTSTMASLTASTTTGVAGPLPTMATISSSTPQLPSVSRSVSGGSSTTVSQTPSAMGSMPSVPNTSALVPATAPSTTPAASIPPPAPAPSTTPAASMPPPAPPATRQSSRLAASAAAAAATTTPTVTIAGTSGTGTGTQPSTPGMGTGGGPLPSTSGARPKRSARRAPVVGPSPKKRRQGMTDDELNALRELDERTIKETRELLEQSDVGKLLYSLMESWFRSLSREVKEICRILKDLVNKLNSEDEEVCLKSV